MTVENSRIQNISFLTCTRVTACRFTSIDRTSCSFCAGLYLTDRFFFAEVTTSPFASVGQGLTSCDDLLRMCHCHCHNNTGATRHIRVRVEEHKRGDDPVDPEGPDQHHHQRGGAISQEEHLKKDRKLEHHMFHCKLKITNGLMSQVKAVLNVYRE